ncbi:hypothetical protein [Oceanispirochaeta sp.]|jgi:hypothetical protein|uniref:hypothetical protein n=1 Tax=Oceanispirochaeta sp. TaxID=2035350 RepID=UPI002609823B|nr:hypothetical protein [Oceanispirochaeta sp.]MDA3956519.1 hypothetical protein [Oceanispirochaeta sp.]
MKHTALLFFLFLFLSCRVQTISTPTPEEQRQYNDIPRRGIAILLDQEIQNGRKILISGNSQAPEQFELLRYLLPVLHDQDSLNIGFWFLEGNSDQEILSYLKNDSAALSESELLFNTDPLLCGFQEYVDFLIYMRDFYNSLDHQETMVITNSDEASVYYSLFRPGIKNSDRTHFLIHSPILMENNRVELPFKGLLYFQMIHEWPLDRFSAIEIKDTLLENRYLTSSDQDQHRTAGMRTDVLILLYYPTSYKPLSRIEGFINEENISEALKSFPGQIIRKKVKPASYLVNKKVERFHRALNRKMKNEYEQILQMEPVLQE